MKEVGDLDVRLVVVACLVGSRNRKECHALVPYHGLGLQEGQTYYLQGPLDALEDRDVKLEIL